MMPDLGKYAFYVVSAYIVSIGLLAGLVWASLRRSTKVRDELRRVEDRKEPRNG
jgi:heme exporter protein D